jgi:hypothetical protein
MSLEQDIDRAIAAAPRRPSGIRLSIDSFKQLEKDGHIVRGSGGPGGLVDWASNVPFFDGDIYAWCDPSFAGPFQLPPAR